MRFYGITPADLQELTVPQLLALWHSMPAVTNREIALAAVAINLGASPIVGDKHAQREFHRTIENMMRGGSGSGTLRPEEITELIKEKEEVKGIADRALARMAPTAETAPAATP